MHFPFHAHKHPRRQPKMKIPHEDAVEDLCARMAGLHLWSTELLETFEPFPRLPKELRRLIFKFALPSSNQMITVTAHCRKLMPKKKVYVFFTAPPQRRGMPPQSKDVKDVRLLKVCWESREVFLENKRGCLPGAGKNLIRFDPKNTPIFIENYAVLARNTALKQAYRSGSWRPKWLKQIERLALGQITDSKWLHSDGKPVSQLSSLQAFKSLRELWLGIADKSLESMHDPKNADQHKQFLELTRLILQPHLDSWADQFAPEHVLPKPRLMAYGIGSVGFGLHP
ncbi:hypothetical protein DL98DRAFT_590640 [Cadophora sp. DSE1049]|nr:hypothetical protein DL98DRAFT_590640 [Cadophora sp. DSE1049]